jgi:phage-related protein (TIGR01555 family)
MGADVLATIKPSYQIELPKPPPGVIPDDVFMAMDSAISGNFAYQQQYAAYTGYGESGFIGYAELSRLSQIPEYRRPVELLAQEQLRKWIRFQATGRTDKTERLKQLAGEVKRLHVRHVFLKALEHDGFFGRGQIFMDFGNNSPEELATPVVAVPQKIAIGSLKRLVNIEPIWTYPNFYNSNNPLALDFYKPRSWYVLGTEINNTRLLTMVTREVADILKPAYVFSGMSLTQMLIPYVQNWLRIRQSVSDITCNFSHPVMATDLGAELNLGAATDLKNRVTMYNTLRDNNSLMVCNKETEDFKIVAAPLSGLDHLQAQAQEHMSGVTGIPLVKFFGVTPSGLNASSDGEMKCFYDGCEARNSAHIDPLLSRLIDYIQLSLWGEIDPEIGYKWEPLWSLNEKEIAEIRRVEAEADAVYLQNNVLAPQESRVRLASQMDSPYASLDLTMDPPDNDPDRMEDSLGDFGDKENDPAKDIPAGGISSNKDPFQ